MRIVCWQTILMKKHTLFLFKTRKDVAKFVVCCSRDWRFKGKTVFRHRLQNMTLVSNAAPHGPLYV